METEVTKRSDVAEITGEGEEDVIQQLSDSSGNGDGSGDGTPASSAVDDKLSLDADGDDTDIDKIIDDIDEQFFDSNTTQLIIDIKNEMNILSCQKTKTKILFKKRMQSVHILVLMQICHCE